MRARRTPTSNAVIGLSGGTEDNDLHARRGDNVNDVLNLDPRDPAAGVPMPYVASVWEPDHEERAALACGDNVELVLMGRTVPPIIMRVTPEQPTSRPQRAGDEPAIWAQLKPQAVETMLAVTDWLNGKFDLNDLKSVHHGHLNDLAESLEPALTELRRREREERQKGPGDE